MPRSILVVDDDRHILKLVSLFLEAEGWRVVHATDAELALDVYDEERPDLALLDLRLPGMSGLELLQALKQRDPDMAALVLTGSNDVPVAVQAMQAGAENFLTKPVSLSHLGAAIERAYEKVRLRRRLEVTHDQAPSPLGTSPQMLELQRQIELVADSNTTVLLLGETGTGKSWAARLIHERSPRARNAIVEVNCGGLSPTFLESELFGHEKGAFTDAKAQKRGLFEVADGGTLFLDEISDLSLDLQPKVLTAIETRRFRRLGGTVELSSDVRLVTASNRPLEQDVKAGRFRRDLYYRISVLPITLPPLRERAREDLLHLMELVLADLRKRLGRGPARLSTEASQALISYAWPGNIRELRNVLERALILAAGESEITPAYLPPDVAGAGRETRRGNPRLSLAAVEKRHIARVLEYVRGNRARAARLLGVSRGTLYQKLRRYELDTGDVTTE